MEVQILVGIATFAGVITVGIGLCWGGFYLIKKIKSRR